MTETAALGLAYLLDLIIGDPRWMPHPVRWIGRLIEKLEASLRNSVEGLDQGRPAGGDMYEEDEINDTWKARYKINLSDLVPPFLRRGKDLTTGSQVKLAGAILVLIVVGVVYTAFYLLGNVLMNIDFMPAAEYIAFALYVYLISTMLATRGLIGSALAVIREMQRGNLEKSRQRLSMIVGRDTEALGEDGVLKAVIETLSENASDGIVAPLFYFVIGGLPLAMTYKAINTLDSMIGYKNRKYRHFGWAAARLDDIANYIPARITGALIIAAVYFINIVRFVVQEGPDHLGTSRYRAVRYIARSLNRVGQKMEVHDFDSARNAFEIMIRDGRKHPSPNSGMPEAAMAGALGIRLGGPSIYAGVNVRKPFIGDDIKKKDEGNMTVDTYMGAAMSAVTITKLTSFFAFLAALILL